MGTREWKWRRLCPSTIDLSTLKSTMGRKWKSDVRIATIGFSCKWRSHIKLSVHFWASMKIIQIKTPMNIQEKWSGTWNLKSYLAVGFGKKNICATDYRIRKEKERLTAAEKSSLKIWCSGSPWNKRTCPLEKTTEDYRNLSRKIQRLETWGIKSLWESLNISHHGIWNRLLTSWTVPRAQTYSHVSCHSLSLDFWNITSRALSKSNIGLSKISQGLKERKF
jgi:hypothetical protein